MAACSSASRSNAEKEQKGLPTWATCSSSNVKGSAFLAGLFLCLQESPDFSTKVHVIENTPNIPLDTFCTYSVLFVRGQEIKTRKEELASNGRGCKALSRTQSADGYGKRNRHYPSSTTRTGNPTRRSPSIVYVNCERPTRIISS